MQSLLLFLLVLSFLEVIDDCTDSVNSEASEKESDTERDDFEDKLPIHSRSVFR